MKTITQYREDIKALDERSAQLCAKATAENRDPSEAELALMDQLAAEGERVKNMVDTLERRERLNASLTVPPTETRQAAQTVSPRIEVGEDLRSRDRFASFGEQLVAGLHASRRHGSVDPRLYNAVSTGLAETIPSDGGFLVQTDFSGQLLEKVWQTALLPSRCQEVPISAASNKATIPGVDQTSRAAGSRGGGIRGYWITEGAEITQSKPKFRKIDLELGKLAGLCDLTDEMLADVVLLESRVRAGFDSEFGFLLDDAIVNGTGAGLPLGILNAGCLVTVDKEDGQDADTIIADNITQMYSRLFASSMNNAVWLINQTVLPQLFKLSIPVGLGGVPIYMPAGGLSASPYGSLLGRPVLALEQCQALGDKGDIILADFQGGYLLATKGGMKSDMSAHVRFEFDESVLKFILRIDGQPVRNTAVTPYKGGSGATQSHFVTLAERA